jgi:hypothetical protein
LEHTHIYTTLLNTSISSIYFVNFVVEHIENRFMDTNSFCFSFDTEFFSFVEHV